MCVLCFWEDLVLPSPSNPVTTPNSTSRTPAVFTWGATTAAFSLLPSDEVHLLNPVNCALHRLWGIAFQISRSQGSPSLTDVLSPSPTRSSLARLSKLFSANSAPPTAVFATYSLGFCPYQQEKKTAKVSWRQWWSWAVGVGGRVQGSQMGTDWWR